jgi:hypothetical protein
MLEQEHPHLPFLWLDTAKSQGEVFALQRAALLSSNGSEQVFCGPP